MIIQKSYALKLASTDTTGDRGQFAGVALVYGEKDAYGDTIRAGAFTKSITESGGRFPLLWTHQPSEVLGSIRVEQDARSLNVTGSLLIDAIPRAAQVHALLKAQAVRGLSVGFLPLRATPQEQGTEFIEGRLLEISLCATPAFGSAQVSEVKAISELAAALDPVSNREALVALRNSIDAMLNASTVPPNPAPELLAAFGSFNPAKWRR